MINEFKELVERIDRERLPGDIEQGCKDAGVSRNIYYYAKERLEKGKMPTRGQARAIREIVKKIEERGKTNRKIINDATARLNAAGK